MGTAVAHVKSQMEDMAAGGTTQRLSGSAMVEMAVVLPVLLMILFAIIEFSIALMRWQTLGSAAGEAAREGSLFRPSCSSVQADADATSVANDILLAANISGATITITGTCVVSGSTSVTITAPYDFMLLPNFVTGLVPTLDLTSSSVVRNRIG